MTVSTHFLELFLRSVCGESSAALMTLAMDVLDDVLRKLCFLFSAVSPRTSPFSYIFAWSYVLKSTPQTRIPNLGNKKNSPGVWKQPRCVQRKRTIDDNRAHYSGSLNMADYWKWTNQERCTAWRPWGGRGLGDLSKGTVNMAIFLSSLSSFLQGPKGTQGNREIYET